MALERSTPLKLPPRPPVDVGDVGEFQFDFQVEITLQYGESECGKQISN